MPVRLTTMAATMAITIAAGPAAPEQTRPVVFRGCVQRTADPTVFLLAVPGEYPDATRGLPKGEPVPPDAGVGPEPRSNPLANPPVGAADEGLPEGRYSTPTILNHSFELAGIDPAKLAPLVGHAIQVTGDLPVGGFPSGDVERRSKPASPLYPLLRAESFKAVAKSCAALIRSK